MNTETELSFIRQVLREPPLRSVEEVASQSHETRRIPDPYVYVVRGGRFFRRGGLFTPGGEAVENFIETDSYLGVLEKSAFEKIQRWAGKDESGLAIWFSPPFPERYPVSKIIIQNLLQVEGQKVVFNRAIVLDIEGQDLVDLANDLDGGLWFRDPETLRANPLFPTALEFSRWFDRLKLFTPQASLIQTGDDLEIKAQTYAMLSQAAALGVGDAGIYEAANRTGLIGRHSESCPPATAFEELLEDSLVIGEVKKLECTCPFCRQKVMALIFKGKIYCPNCKKSATYIC